MKRFFILFYFIFSNLLWAEQQLNETDQKRYQSLIHDIRCPTCQNSNIAESNAPLAKQLRSQVLELLQQGRSDTEIQSYLVERYGDFIHYRPPFQLNTFILWFAPFLLMGISAFYYFRQRKNRPIVTVQNNEKALLQFSENKRLPIPALLILLFSLLSVFYFWLNKSGHYAYQWEILKNQLDSPIQRAIYLNNLPDLSQTENPLIFCQALQENINRENDEEIAVLARCYTASGAYNQAIQAYKQLTRENPQNNEYRFDLAQNQLFLRPNAPILPETEALLKQVIETDKNHLLAKMLLAAAYEKSNRPAEALPLWTEIAPQIPESDPLHDYIKQRLTPQFQINQTIDLKVKTENLPPEALIFITIGTPNQPFPPLMAKALPILPQQKVEFNQQDMMQNTPLNADTELLIRAFISADGTIKGEKLATFEQVIKINTKVEIEL